MPAYQTITVRDLQKALVVWGDLAADPREVDGIYGPVTQAALAKYTRRLDVGIPMPGRVAPSAAGTAYEFRPTEDKRNMRVAPDAIVADILNAAGQYASPRPAQAPSRTPAATLTPLGPPSTPWYRSTKFWVGVGIVVGTSTALFFIARWLKQHPVRNS